MSHHMDVLKAGQHEGLQELATDAPGAHRQDLGLGNLHRDSTPLTHLHYLDTRGGGG